MKNFSNTRNTRTRFACTRFARTRLACTCLVRALGTQSLRHCAAALAAVIVSTMAACDTSTGSGDDDGGGTSISGTVTAGDISATLSSETSGTGVHFQVYSGSFGTSVPDQNLKITVTTDLPAPNNSFVLDAVHRSSDAAKKTITGLSAGQQVKWTATVPGGTIEAVPINPEYPRPQQVLFGWSWIIWPRNSAWHHFSLGHPPVPAAGERATQLVN